jgi:hypothetical protein
MTRVAVLLLAALSTDVPMPAIVAPQSGRAADEAAVRTLVDRYMAAREAQDASAVAALFTADARCVPRWDPSPPTPPTGRRS